MEPWPDAVEEILDGDHVVMLAYVTPALGVVLAPVTNFGAHDRAAGTVTVNSSVGAWKKLDRIRRNAQVALAFHTRAHARHSRPEYVLVQGRAALSAPIPDYPAMLENWGRVEDWEGMGRVWKRWLRVYALRVEIEIAVERLVVWPDLGCGGGATTHGKPLPGREPEAQRAPRRGTAPRLNHVRAARAAARLSEMLLGWVGRDGFPMAVPARVDGTDEGGIVLGTPPGLVPAGGRRAGLTAHWFARGVVGQHQRVHTGWLDASAPRVVYSPHTAATYRFPASTTLYRLAAGGGTRWRLRGARRVGLLEPNGRPKRPFQRPSTP